MAKIKDITGKRYGRLTVVSLDPVRTKSRSARWLCLCDCGNETVVPGGDLHSVTTRSCGCLQGEHHGMRNSPEYAIWNGIINRCENPNYKNYKQYGARGITISKEWRGSFIAFFEEVGLRPSLTHQIDRIDNRKGYESGNCRWVTCSENNKNRSNSKWWFVHGVKYDSSTKAAERLGVHKQSIIQWCNGYHAKGRFYPPKPGCRSELKYAQV